MAIARTYEEHLDYLLQMTRLKCWFMWDWCRKHPDEDIIHCLRERVDIYRKSNINRESLNPQKQNFDHPEWRQLEKTCIELLQKFQKNDDGKGFEESCFELFEPTVTARSQRDFEERPYVLDYACGSLNYDPPHQDCPDRIFMHIANAVQPSSLFDDRTYLPNCLVDLMDTVSAQHSQVHILRTSTWLNQHPKWLELFPQIWIEHMQPAQDDVQWHFGFWGQFISARGTFNHRLARRFRDSGRMPYLPQDSWLEFTDLKAHLHKHFL